LYTEPAFAKKYDEGVLGDQAIEDEEQIADSNSDINNNNAKGLANSQTNSGPPLAPK
jgi:hypothetical protein